MKKLVSLLIAAAFALSSGFAVAASHAGAQPMEKKEAAKKEAKKADKKAAKKTEKKGDKAAKKDEKK